MTLNSPDGERLGQSAQIQWNNKRSKNMQLLKNLFHDQGGQTATEYMVLLASVVAVILAAAWKFTGLFEGGVKAMGGNVAKNLGEGFK